LNVQFQADKKSGAFVERCLSGALDFFWNSGFLSMAVMYLAALADVSKSRISGRDQSGDRTDVDDGCTSGDRMADISVDKQEGATCARCSVEPVELPQLVDQTSFSVGRTGFVPGSP
jgi:hypothetical protein